MVRVLDARDSGVVCCFMPALGTWTVLYHPYSAAIICIFIVVSIIWVALLKRNEKWAIGSGELSSPIENFSAWLTVLYSSLLSMLTIFVLDMDKPWENWAWVFFIAIYLLCVLGLVTIVAKTVDGTGLDATGKNPFWRVLSGLLLSLMLVVGGTVGNEFLGPTSDQETFWPLLIVSLALGVISAAIGSWSFKLHPRVTILGVNKEYVLRAPKGMALELSTGERVENVSVKVSKSG